jgi:hypothetical protein
MTTTTFRFPDDMAQALKSAAAEKGITVNELARQLIRDHLKVREERALYDSFTELGKNREEVDVEYAIHAASEVVLRDE